MEPVVLLVCVPVMVLYFGAIAYGIAQIIRSASLNDPEKWVWAIAMVAFPIVSAIVWFAAGPHPLGLKLGRDRV